MLLFKYINVQIYLMVQEYIWLKKNIYIYKWLQNVEIMKKN